jgi:NAD(P)-dependent dehydrogenase (short-subunit alcohol dehydrogenase family)
MHPVLDHKVIVVIGGTSGLGLSASRAFVNAGARVVVAGRDPEKLKAAVDQLGAASAGLQGDASDSEVAERAIALALERFSGFHGLYHVAGGSGRRFGDGPLHEVTDSGIDETLKLNLKPVIYSNRAAVRHWLKAKQGGAILNMASVLGFSPSPKYFGTHVYAATKAAVIGFSKSTAAYYAPDNIRVNVIAPALVDTPMARRAMNDESILKFIRTKQPLDGGRAGVPADCDAAAAWLMSDESRFVTGQVLAIDGGWSVCEGQY